MLSMHIWVYSLSSPDPCFAVLPDDESLLATLDGRRVVGLMSTGKQGGTGSTDIIEDVGLAALGDRLDGVALLAEALSQSTATGQYLQLIRLFERAFRLGPEGLKEPLAEFLRTSLHEFDTSEVSSWLSARAFSFHADRRDEIYLEADLRPFSMRMLEAGYDVLLNKESWRTKSPTRRDTWRPAAGSSDTSGGIFITQGKAASISFQIFDPFGAYPTLLASSIDLLLPKAAWLTHQERELLFMVRGGETKTAPTDAA